MSVVKVNGGRRLEESCETDGDELAAANGSRGRLRRNSSLKEKSSVEYDALVDDWDPVHAAKERREPHRNPLQKAVSGVRNMFRNLANTSVTLPRQRSFDDDLDPATDQSRPTVVRSRPRANSVGSTERSPPSRQQRMLNYTLPNGRQPGAVGIQNHGNSCFLNAVIQCLSNTDLLVEYLFSDEMKDHVEKSGQDFDVTRQLVALIKSLWMGTYDYDVSSLFKQIVGEHAEQYSGTMQNDAQEFLLWLLDKVNEELCNFTEKDNQTQLKNTRARNKNSSIIYDLFEAKYRSTLTCPSCRQQSNTYDPFLSVSLPIQLKNTLPVYVTVAYMKPYYRQVLYGLMMNTGDTVAQLRRILSKRTGIKEKQLLLTQVYDGKFQSTLHDSELLEDLNTLQFLYAVELYDYSGSSGNTFDDEYSGTESVCIVAVNRVRDSTRQSSRFGGPFVINVSRDSTMLHLRAALLGGMHFMIPDGCMEQVLVEGQFSMRLVSDIGRNIYLSNFDELPLYAVAIDDALTLCSEDMPPHIMLVLEWRYADYKRLLVSTHPPVHCDQSYERLKASLPQKSVINLQDCFSAFTQQEQLGDEDTWLCPNCHKHQRGTIKSLNLSSLPDIMIIHLKRFRQEGDNRSKLNTLIKFPITNLDMTYHLTQGQPANDISINSMIQEDYIYDLYGVCNHEGAMSQGHYKAICKNPLSGQWYIYDDVNVSVVREDHIVTRNAYLLFYKRRMAKSRCQRELGYYISQLLETNGIKIVDPKPESKPVTPNKSSVTAQPTHSVRSPNHLVFPNSSVRYQMNSSFTHVPRTRHSQASNGFHASLRKPPPRRIPAVQWAADRRFVGNTSLTGRSLMTRSKTQPLQQKSSLPANGYKKMNAEEKLSDDVDLSTAASVLTDSAILDAIARPANSNKPKLIFKKVQNNNVDSYSNGTGIVPEIGPRPLNTWQHKPGKFIQESAV